MKEIFLDTNFIISSLKNKIDIDTEISRILDSRYVLRIVEKTIFELEKINNEYSGIAIDLIKKEGIKQIESNARDVDTALVDQRHAAGSQVGVHTALVKGIEICLPEDLPGCRIDGFHLDLVILPVKDDHPVTGNRHPGKTGSDRVFPEQLWSRRRPASEKFLTGCNAITRRSQDLGPVTGRRGLAAGEQQEHEQGNLEMGWFH